MRSSVGMAMALLLGLMTVAPGCAEENTGDLSNRDLGTADRALVPTGLTFTDAAVVKGSAQWQKLREPNFDHVADAKHSAHGAGDEMDAGEPKDAVESAEVVELRELVADYNAVVAEENFEDLVGFFVESQVEAAEKLVQVVPGLAGKLLELNAALPEPNAELSKSVESIALTKLFHLDVGSITMVSDSSATGEVTKASGGGVVKFVVEEEEWYFEHPLVASVAGSLAELEQGMGALDLAITAIKSGAVEGDALDATVGAALDILILLTPDDASDEPESDDAADT